MRNRTSDRGVYVVTAVFILSTIERQDEDKLFCELEFDSYSPRLILPSPLQVGHFTLLDKNSS